MAVRFTASKLLATAMALLLTAPALASGPFLPDAVFVTTSGSDPRDATGFHEGRLGVVLPSVPGAKLAAAYRALIGKPLSKAEALAIGRRVGDPPSAYDVAAKWQEARNRLMDHLPRLDLPNFAGYWAGFQPPYVKCSMNAAEVAIETLGQRIARHGARTPWVENWTRGQDQVFAACGDEATIPLAAPEDAPQWFRHDRAYQIAAANFYAGNFDEAADLFRAIAADRDSPWSGIAPYLVVRVLKRKSLASTWVWGGAPERRSLPPEETTIAAANALLRDPAMAGWHEPTRDILRQLAFHADRPGMVAEFERRFLGPESAGLSADALNDYLLAGERIGQLPMGKWIRAMQGTAKVDAFDIWKADGGLPWLVAASMQPGLELGQAREIIDAAAKVGRDSPAYAHLSYFRVLLLIEQGRIEEARAALAEIDFGASAITLQARNLLRSLQLRLAPDLASFAAAAPRAASYFYNAVTRSEENGPAATPFTAAEMNGDSMLAWRWELRGRDPLYFMGDGVATINRFLPLDQILRLMRLGSLPAQLHDQVLAMAFARAVALGRHDTAQALAPRLARAIPEQRELIEAFAGANDAEERRFLAAMTMLRLPGASIVLRPDLGYYYRPHVIGSYGTRWWDDDDRAALARKDDAAKTVSAGRFDCDYGECYLRHSSDPPPFVDKAMLAQAKAETAALAGLPLAGELFGREVMRYAVRHPADARLPEALHLVVRATRYSEVESDISREAWSLLHRRYPADPWTRRTRFYY